MISPNLSSKQAARSEALPAIVVPGTKIFLGVLFIIVLGAIIWSLTSAGSDVRESDGRQRSEQGAAPLPAGGP